MVCLQDRGDRPAPATRSTLKMQLHARVVMASMLAYQALRLRARERLHRLMPMLLALIVRSKAATGHQENTMGGKLCAPSELRALA
jgi:hypothetical protein